MVILWDWSAWLFRMVIDCAARLLCCMVVRCGCSVRLSRVVQFRIVIQCGYSLCFSVWSVNMIISYGYSLPPSLFRFRSAFGAPQILSVVHVDRRSDEGLDEIEDCWQLRDSGYNTIWVSEVSCCCLDRCYPLLPLLPLRTCYLRGVVRHSSVSDTCAWCVVHTAVQHYLGVPRYYRYVYVTALVSCALLYLLNLLYALLLLYQCLFCAQHTWVMLG